MSDRSTRLNLENTSEEVISPATEEKQDDIIAIFDWTNDLWNVWLLDWDDNRVDVQYPIPTDWDSIYEKDINKTVSTSWTFTGNIEDLFNNYTLIEALVDTSATNPKTFTVQFKRPVTTTAFWIWSGTSNFSNVKLQFTDLSWTVRRTVDDSANNTKYTTNIYQFAPTSFAAIIVEFHTADTVKLNWALINKDQSVVSRLQWISSITWAVENIWSLKGALSVHVSDLHVFAVNKHFSVVDWVSTTLDAISPVDDTILDVVDTTWFIVWQSIRLTEGTITEYDDLIITAIWAWTPWTLTLDRPLDFAYTTAATVEVVDIDLQAVSATATLSSPVTAIIAPPAWEIWHILRILINTTHSSAADDGRFWNIATWLTNWMVLRQVTNTVWRQTISNWKTNWDMKEDMYDVSYSDRAWGWLYWTSARFTFKKSDFIIELNWDYWDQLKLILQDDISSLEKFSIKAQWHKTDS